MQFVVDPDHHRNLEEINETYEEQQRPHHDYPINFFDTKSVAQNVSIGPATNKREKIFMQVNKYVPHY